MRQRILGSHTPPCHRRMVITTQFNVSESALLRCSTDLFSTTPGGREEGGQGRREEGGQGVRQRNKATPIFMLRKPPASKSAVGAGGGGRLLGFGRHPRMVTCELSRVCWLKRSQHNMQHMQITRRREKACQEPKRP